MYQALRSAWSVVWYSPLITICEVGVIKSTVQKTLKFKDLMTFPTDPKKENWNLYLSLFEGVC